MKSFRTVDDNGNIHYKNENRLYHREDGPAIIWTSGSVFYFLNNKRYYKEDWEVEVIKLKLKRILDL